MHRATYLWECFILTACVADAAVNFPFHFSGIPVPGRRVSALQQFQLYAASCQITKSAKEVVDQLSQMIESIDGEQIAEKMQRNYYFMVDDLDVEKMMGRWFTVVDSPSVHGERCVASYYSSLHTGGKLSTFSCTQYSRSNEGDVKVMHGMGEKIGPDPGNLLIITGHPNDHCPYFPVKMGPINDQGQYDYMVLTQALKYPTMVLVRDVERFESTHRAQIKAYLDRYGYMKPPLSLTPIELHFANTTSCTKANEYYFDMDSEGIE